MKIYIWSALFHRATINKSQILNRKQKVQSVPFYCCDLIIILSAFLGLK